MHQSIPVTRFMIVKEDNKEVLWLMLKPLRTPHPFSSVFVAVVYYPPDQNVERGIDIKKYLTRNLDRFLCDRLPSAIVIAGDFNK